MADKFLEISEGIFIVDLALHIPKEKVLIISDVHIGYEEALNKQGILVPRMQFDLLLKRLENIFRLIGVSKKNKLAQFIINGDVKHEFGTISEQEWRQTLMFIDFISQYSDEIVLIKGNHDTTLGPLADKRNLSVVDEAVIDDVLVLHGDDIPDHIDKTMKKTKTIIIGHEHPAIAFPQNPLERYKCFLKGLWKRQRSRNALIVMPSFFLFNEGTDVLKESLLSPFLKRNEIRSFEAYVVDTTKHEDNVLFFGKLDGIPRIIRR